MLEVVMCSIALGSLMTVLIVLTVSFFNALVEGGFRRFFSIFIDNIKDSFSFASAVAIILSILFIFPVYSAKNHAESEQKGECICHCKRCQKNSKMIEKFLIRASKLEAENLKLWQTNVRLRAEKVAKEENP